MACRSLTRSRPTAAMLATLPWSMARAAEAAGEDDRVHIEEGRDRGQGIAAHDHDVGRLQQRFQHSHTLGGSPPLESVVSGLDRGGQNDLIEATHASKSSQQHAERGCTPEVREDVPWEPG